MYFLEDDNSNKYYARPFLCRQVKKYYNIIMTHSCTDLLLSLLFLYYCSHHDVCMCIHRIFKHI